MGIERIDSWDVISATLSSPSAAAQVTHHLTVDVQLELMIKVLIAQR